jgi:O-antigen/teichoic acid export membrane protein
MIKRIRNYINRSEFTKNTLTLFTGATVAQIIPVLISPVLSRLFTPADFGLLALYMSIAGILAVFASGRYEMAIMLPKKDEDAINIFSLSLFFCIVISILIAVAVLIFNTQITNLTGNIGISFYLYFLPLTVFSLAFYKVLLYWFNRNNQFKKIAISKVINSSVNSFSSLILGIFKKGSLGLIFSWIIGQLISMIYLLVKMLKENRGFFKYVRRPKMIALAKRYKKFPLFDTWSELLNVLAAELPVIVLIRFFGEEITGHYSFTYKVLLLPFSLLAFSIGQAYFKKASELKDSLSSVSNFTLSVFKKLVLISFVPLSIIAVFGDFLFPFIFGIEWKEAGAYSRIFSVWVFAIFITSPLTNIFAVFERQRTNLIFNLITFIIRTGLLIALSVKTGDALTVVFWYALSGFIFRMIYLVIIASISRLEFLKVLKVLLKAVAFCSILMGLRYLIPIPVH